jgi:ATP-dependent Clp protease ATP-binding subunit ClpC
LPDKALDVLDEAGSLVRLENHMVPLGLEPSMEELRQTLIEKEKAAKDQDYNVAQQLVDYEVELRTYIRVVKQSLEVREKAGLLKRDDLAVTENDVSKVIAGWTGIPVTKISEDESKKLLDMEKTLHERLIGQHHAIVSVSKAVRRARVGLRNPNRPIASFIFAGPTGVGKTELTKALASYLFGSEDVMVRLDMSEYMEKHTVAKLIGSPPGYVGYSEGGQLTEAIRSKPYTVVLFDEIEKAHPDVFNLLLQILDDGRLTDSKGRTIDFKNTLIIMTSNVGASIIEKESGLQNLKKENSSDIYNVTSEYFLSEPNDPLKDPTLLKRMTSLVNEELKKYFRPEFLNRLDEIIVFSHLNRSNIVDISELIIKELTDRMKKKEVELIITLPVQRKLVDEGYDPIYGARPLRRAAISILEDNLASAFLSKPLYPNTIITIDCVNGDSEENVFVDVNYENVDPKLLEGNETIQ